MFARSFSLLSIACVLLVSTPASARRIVYPRFRHTSVTLSFLQVDAGVRIMRELRQIHGPAATSQANQRRSQSGIRRSLTVRTFGQARSSPVRLSAAAWRAVPFPKPFMGAGSSPANILRRPQSVRRITSASGASVQVAARAIDVQEIGMARFDSLDCTLRPYVFTFTYDLNTAALLGEQARIATAAESQAAHLPERISAC